MKKIRLVTFLFILISTFLTGCDFLSELHLFPSPTPNPLYVHYSPSDSSHILLEFDYPKNWVFQEEAGSESKNFFIIGLLDPRGVFDPNNLNQERCSSSICGSVAIIMEPLSSEKNLKDRIESLKEIRNSDDYMKELNAYQMDFHGYPAYVLEYQVDFSGNGERSSMLFDRNLIFQVGDKMYWIMSQIPEIERGGDFEIGYDYLINSMKILPAVQK